MPGFSLRKFVLAALAIAAAVEGASSYSDAKTATDAALHQSDTSDFVRRTGTAHTERTSVNGIHPSDEDWYSGEDKWQQNNPKASSVKGGSDGGALKSSDFKDQDRQPTNVKRNQFTTTPTDPQSFPNPSGQPRQRRSAKGRSLDSLDGNPMLIAKSVCPDNLFGCPIAETGSLSRLPADISTWFMDGFECFDLENDLRACGGCASVDKVHDCTTIIGADSVSCESSRCVVQSCKQGFTLDEDDNTCVSTN